MEDPVNGPKDGPLLFGRLDMAFSFPAQLYSRGSALQTRVYINNLMVSTGHP